MAATGLVLAADLELAALNQDSVAHIVTNAGELGAVCGVILGTAETIYELKDYKKLLNLKALPKTLARHFTLQSEYIRPMMILKLLTLKK